MPSKIVVTIRMGGLPYHPDVLSDPRDLVTSSLYPDCPVDPAEYLDKPKDNKKLEMIDGDIYQLQISIIVLGSITVPNKLFLDTDVYLSEKEAVIRMKLIGVNGWYNKMSQIYYPATRIEYIRLISDMKTTG